MNSLVRDKFKAAGIHLLISLFLALLSFLLIYLVWYPTPLVKATGVEGLFLMMLGIDLILGPTFTFIVYKKLKKTLKFDLWVIAIIQLSAMLYGIFSMYQGRPIWIAFAGDRFELIKANDLVESETKHIKIPYFGPDFTYVNVKPVSAKEQLNMMLEEAQSGINPVQKPERHQKFSFASIDISQKAISLTELESYNNVNLVHSILRQYPNANSWLPLSANRLDMVILLNKEKAEVVEIVDLRPWK